MSSDIRLGPVSYASTVSFVGVSVVLGEPAPQLDAATRFPQRNIKVFAAPGSLGLVGGNVPP